MDSTLIHKYLALILATLFVCASVGGYVALSLRILHERQVFTDARAELARITQEEASQALQDAYVERTMNDVRELRTYILSLEDPLPFLTLVEDDIARTSGVTVTVDTFVEEGTGVVGVGGGAVLEDKAVRVVLSAVGTWEGVYRFLDMVERVPYAIRSDRVTLTDETEGESKGWKAQVSLRVLAQ